MNRLLRVVCWLRRHHDWGPWQTVGYDEVTKSDRIARICRTCSLKQTGMRYRPLPTVCAGPVPIRPPWKPAPHVKVRMKPKTAFEKRLWEEKKEKKQLCLLPYRCPAAASPEDCIEAMNNLPCRRFTAEELAKMGGKKFVRSF